jgi:transcriptional regulator with XRE-family HTH domain
VDGRLVTQAMGQLKISRNQLEKDLGVSRITVWRYERGQAPDAVMYYFLYNGFQERRKELRV